MSAGFELGLKRGSWRLALCLSFAACSGEIPSTGPGGTGGATNTGAGGSSGSLGASGSTSPSFGGNTTGAGGNTTSAGGVATGQGGVIGSLGGNTTSAGGAATGQGGVVGSQGGSTTTTQGGTTQGGSGTTSSGGSASGGAKATGGASGMGGGTSGGSTATGGSTGTGGSTTTPGCGQITKNPFSSCKFAWGTASNGSNSSYLNFVSTWIGDEPNGGLASLSATATNNSCGDCSLVQSVASTNSMVVFYAYFIGFQACKVGGFCDCNTDRDGQTLCNGGAQWIKSNRAAIVNMYGQYAKKVYAASPNKPTIWWLEGDYIQYSYPDQSSPLSYAELGSLARDITCAIKSNQPNAVVAMNHSPWIATDLANGFWGAQPVDVLDLVWVQGPGDTDTFVNSGTYNAAVANYAWLHQKTGRNIMAETSFAGSGANDRWTTTTAANINARIANGVIGVLVNNPPSNYQSVMGTLGAGLTGTCN